MRICEVVFRREIECALAFHYGVFQLIQQSIVQCLIDFMFDLVDILFVLESLSCFCKDLEGLTMVSLNFLHHGALEKLDP